MQRTPFPLRILNLAGTWLGVFCCSIFAANIIQAQATTKWTGDGSTGDVTDPNNWSGTVPTTSVLALFGSTGPQWLSLDGSTPLATDSSFFRNGAWVLSGGELLCSSPSGSSLQVSFLAGGTATVKLKDGALGTKLTCVGTAALALAVGSSGFLIVEDGSCFDQISVAGSNSRFAIGMQGYGELLVQTGAAVKTSVAMNLGETFGGAGGKLIVQDPSSMLSAQWLNIGCRAPGELLVANAGQAISVGGLDSAVSASVSGVGSALITVTDPGSLLSIAQDGSDSVFARVGAVRLNILQGGVLRTGGLALLAQQPSSDVTLSVVGSGSRLECLQAAGSGDGLIIGELGRASLDISSGAIVQVDSWTRLGTQLGSTATLTIQDSGSRLSTFGIVVDDSGANLAASMLVQLSSGGLLDVSTLAIVRAGGRLELDGGSLHSQQLLVEGGGQLSGAGDLEGPVHVDGQLELGLLSASLNFADDLSLGATARTDVLLTAANSKRALAPLQVMGALDLSGDLVVQLASGFTAQQGDLFVLASCSNIQGAFEQVITPAWLSAQGLQVRPIYQADAVLLRVERIGAVSVRVVMGEASLALRSAQLWAIDPADLAATPVALGVSDANGFADISAAPAGEWILAAELSYVEPASGDLVSIRNYPGAEPLRSYNLSSGDSVIPEIRFPWPLLMQGGLGGGSFTWTKARAYLEQDPLLRSSARERALPAFACFPMPNNSASDGSHPGGYDNDGSSLVDHTLNAQRLDRWARGEAADVWSPWLAPGTEPKFLLLAHSMGGLISRSYALESGKYDNTPRIVTLDAIHGGTANGLTRFKPMLSQAALNGVSATPGTMPQALGELGWNEGREVLEGAHRWLLFAAVDDNIIDPFSSALGHGQFVLPNSNIPSGVGAQWVKGIEIEVPGVTHKTITEDPSVLLQVAEFLATGSAQTNTPSSSSLRYQGTPPLGAGLDGPKAHRKLQLKAAAGARSTLSLQLESGSQIQATLMLSGEGASYALRGARGVHVALPGLRSSSIERGLRLDLVDLSNLAGKRFSLELRAGAREPAKLELLLEYGNGIRLRSRVSSDFVSVGDSLHLTSWFEDATGRKLVGNADSMPARLLSPSGSRIAITLWDDGLHDDGAAKDGLFGQRLRVTEAGRFRVTGDACLTMNGECMDRSSESRFRVQAARASISGFIREWTPDLDGNGLHDALVIEQNVYVSSAGTYRLSMLLQDSKGGIIARLGKTFNAAPGTSRLRFHVPGAEIVRAGQDGPYLITDVYLQDVGLSLGIERGTDSWTRAYGRDAFEPPSAPVISGSSPSGGSPRGGNLVRIFGASLQDISQVWLGNQQVEIVYRGTDMVTIQIPSRKADRASLSAGSGSPRTEDIRIVGPWGSAAVQHAYAYR